MSSLPKVRVTFEIYSDSLEMLAEVARRYGMADPSKALRCLLDYAATDGDWPAMFEEVRCRRCG